MSTSSSETGLLVPEQTGVCRMRCGHSFWNCSSEYGISQAGAYFWRPPEIPHGPHGSHGGAFMLIRFMEGTHRNDWTDTKRQFDLNPAYRPALPEGLGDVARLKQAATILRNY